MNLFIPRPDSTVWAKERNYLTEDGRKALQEFALCAPGDTGEVERAGRSDLETKSASCNIWPNTFSGSHWLYG